MAESAWDSLSVLDTLPYEERQKAIDKVGKAIFRAKRDEIPAIETSVVSDLVDAKNNENIIKYLLQKGISVDNPPTEKQLRSAYEMFNTNIGTDFSYQPASKMPSSHPDKEKFDGGIYGVTDPMTKTIYVDERTPNPIDTLLHETGHAKERMIDPAPMRGSSEAKFIPLDVALSDVSKSFRPLENYQYGNQPLVWRDDLSNFPQVPDMASLPFNEKRTVLGTPHLRPENQSYNLLQQLMNAPEPMRTYLPQDVPLKNTTEYQKYLNYLNRRAVREMSGIPNKLTPENIKALK